MSLTKTIGLVAATTFASVAFGAVETSNDTLAQIAELRAELASIKAQNGGEQWLTEQRATQIRGIVQDVLADSETRQSLQASGATSGYNGGFFIGSADGNNSLKINILEQIRFTYNNSTSTNTGAKDTGTGDNDTSTWGFENKRTRMTFSGNIVDSSWTYNVSTYFAYDNNAEFAGELANAYVNKDFGNGFSVTAGQFQFQSGVEQGTDAGNLQFIERSTVSYLFGLGYTLGMALNYASDQFRLTTTFNNGAFDANDSWGPGSPDTDASFGGRFEYKCAGTWAQFADQQSWRGEESGFLLGGGIANETNSTAADDSVMTWTVDGTYEFGGGNIAAAYFARDFGNATPDQTGYTVSGGFFVSDDMELVARYEWASSDGAPSDQDWSAMTAGMNWYFSKNTAKLNTSVGYSFNGISTFVDNEAEESNWLRDDEDGQWTIQAQLSFSF